jgi:hypothetical protein
MTRLTKNVREQMAVILLKKRFIPECEAMAARSAALFHKVYEDIYDVETRGLMAKIIAKHKYGLEWKDVVSVNANGYRIDLGRKAVGWIHIKVTAEFDRKPFLKQEQSVVHYGDYPITEHIITFATDARSLSDTISRAYVEIMGVLGQCTTAKQLANLWPEALPLVGHLILHDKPGLPSIQFSGLNAAYGLQPVAAGEGA